MIIEMIDLKSTKNRDIRSLNIERISRFLVDSHQTIPLFLFIEARPFRTSDREFSAKTDTRLISLLAPLKKTRGFLSRAGGR